MAPYRGFFARKVTPTMILVLLVCGFAFIVLISIFSWLDESKISEMKYGNINTELDTQNFKSLDDQQMSLDGNLLEEQPNLIYRVNDLKKVKLSINNELRVISRERSKIMQDVAELHSKNEKILSQISKNKAQLRQLETDLTSNKKRKSNEGCDNFRLTPVVFNPMKSVSFEHYAFGAPIKNSLDNVEYDQQATDQRDYNLDISKCPLTVNFKFDYHIYTSSKSPDQYILSELSNILLENKYHQNLQGNNNCMSLYLVGSASDINQLNDILRPNLNNILLFTNATDLDLAYKHGMWRKAALVTYEFKETTPFRSKLDVIIPSVMMPSEHYTSIIGARPVMMPLAKKYLASYFGSIDIARTNSGVAKLEQILQTIHRNSYEEPFLFMYDCGLETGQRCYEQRVKLIELSNFLIILPPSSGVMDKHTNDLIYSSLSKGTIPVIIGKDKVRLPFDEVIDWRRSSLILPVSRLPELHFILSTYSPSDIYKLKYNGKQLFENHLATVKQILDTTIALFAVERFNFPPPPVDGLKTNLHDIKQDNHGSILDWASSQSGDNSANSSYLQLSSEMLGPHETPLRSANYRRNMSLVFNSAFDLWNDPLHSPLRLYPSLPMDPITPSDYKFLSGDQSYRPIASGAGGSGLEFSRDLGGDMPNEQFTIVLLTYERIENLLKTLDRLKGMPYVNKFLIVWNSVNRPPSAINGLKWPTNLGAPLKVVQVDKNSLNNRFLPYDEIETDAILSLDDDTPLRQDEIVFAFRVWRESRDRVVGFPGRFHAWDQQHQSWIYNSNHSCELSMVLTGGAFFHRYYLYVYSFEMPATIRQIVDNLMNCEDIAMNFLVAHLTRKTPIKVTSRWTFTCTDCPSSLSDDQSHFRERHECLNIFASIYGYMPLLSTQHRSDSVLFKTRLPLDKQKCFRFV